MPCIPIVVSATAPAASISNLCLVDAVSRCRRTLLDIADLVHNVVLISAAWVDFLVQLGWACIRAPPCLKQAAALRPHRLAEPLEGYLQWSRPKSSTKLQMSQLVHPPAQRQTLDARTQPSSPLPGQLALPGPIHLEPLVAKRLELMAKLTPSWECEDACRAGV